ncbi:MAG: hypothetical protein R3C61_07155 [Bacteroidia bacterium]
MKKLSSEPKALREAAVIAFMKFITSLCDDLALLNAEGSIVVKGSKMIGNVTPGL